MESFVNKGYAYEAYYELHRDLIKIEGLDSIEKRARDASKENPEFYFETLAGILMARYEILALDTNRMLKDFDYIKSGR